MARFTSKLHQIVTVLILSVTLSSVLGGPHENYVTVDTSYGTLRGFLDSNAAVPIAKFYGVPYARPPVGKFFSYTTIPKNYNLVIRK